MFWCSLLAVVSASTHSRYPLLGLMTLVPTAHRIIQIFIHNTIMTVALERGGYLIRHLSRSLHIFIVSSTSLQRLIYFATIFCIPHLIIL